MNEKHFFPELAADIIEPCCSIDGGELIVDSLPVSHIAEQCGTPLFIYLPNIFKKKLESLRKALPDFEVYYSVKANPTPAVVDFFSKQKCGLEIASSGELKLALTCGGTPSKIIFAGPGKTEEELTLALEAGISEIHVESFEEINRLTSLAKKHDRTIPVSIRFNPSDVARGGAMVMGGKPTAFGMDEEMVVEAIEKVLQSDNLLFHGLHCYSGTQIVDYDVIVDMYGHYLEFASTVSNDFRIPFTTLDFGGGFGIPYFDTDILLDLDTLSESLQPIIREARNTTWLKETRFIIEPGRFLVGEGGLYIARVLDVKKSRDETFVILDGGMNHHIVATGHFGQIIKRNVPMSVANKMNGAADETYTIVGPLCTPLDTLGRNVSLPHIDIGDLIVFFQSGAYVRSQSPVRFLSRREPMELFVEDGAMKIVRRRGEDSDVFYGTSYEHGPGRE